MSRRPNRSQSWARRHAIAGLFVAAALLPMPAAAQSPAMATETLEAVGSSPVARELLVELAENSSMLATVLKELGIRAAPAAQSAARLASLSSVQWGAAIVHSDTLAEAFASRSATTSGNLEAVLGTFNTLRAGGVGASALPGAARKAAGPFLTMELGTGDVTLSRPFVICDNGLCRVQLQKFNAYKWGTAGAGTLCLSGSCMARLNDFFTAALHGGGDEIDRSGGAPPASAGAAQPALPSLGDQYRFDGSTGE